MYSASRWIALLAASTIVDGLALPKITSDPLHISDRSWSHEQPIVDFGYSQYQGSQLSSGVNQFLGIRYAAPPLGDLRFRAPVPPLPTTGIQSALSVLVIFPSFSSSISN